MFKGLTVRRHKSFGVEGLMVLKHGIIMEFKD
jgi:hypothetical protein